MTQTMNCFVTHGIGKVGLMEKPIPGPRPNDAIICTKVALICTSDTHTVAGAIGDRQGLTLGHEAVGMIQEPGAGLTTGGYDGVQAHSVYHNSQRSRVRTSLSSPPATAKELS